jgi:hypothetical protein
MNCPGTEIQVVIEPDPGCGSSLAENRIYQHQTIPVCHGNALFPGLPALFSGVFNGGQSLIRFGAAAENRQGKTAATALEPEGKIKAVSGTGLHDSAGEPVVCTGWSITVQEDMLISKTAPAGQAKGAEGEMVPVSVPGSSKAACSGHTQEKGIVKMGLSALI